MRQMWAQMVICFNPNNATLQQLR